MKGPRPPGPPMSSTVAGCRRVEAWSPPRKCRDVDSDGHDDLLLGAYGNDDGGGAAAGYTAGAAYLVLGPRDGDFNLSRADARLVGEASYDYAGACAAGVGDVDDDGRDDVLVGASYNAAGAAHLAYGGGL